VVVGSEVTDPSVGRCFDTELQRPCARRVVLDREVPARMCGEVVPGSIDAEGGNAACYRRIEADPGL
jgi:hypothetical protein